MAVRVRFELTEPVKVQRFSRPPHSTTLPPHRFNAPGFNALRSTCLYYTVFFCLRARTVIFWVLFSWRLVRRGLASSPRTASRMGVQMVNLWPIPFFPSSVECIANRGPEIGHQAAVWALACDLLRQQSLYLRPLPQGQASLRPTLGVSRRKGVCAFCAGLCT